VLNVMLFEMRAERNFCTRNITLEWIGYLYLSTIGLFLIYRTDSTDYLTISGFTSLNGLICLHSVLDKAGSQSVFKRT